MIFQSTSTHMVISLLLHCLLGTSSTLTQSLLFSFSQFLLGYLFFLGYVMHFPFSFLVFSIFIFSFPHFDSMCRPHFGLKVGDIFGAHFYHFLEGFSWGVWDMMGWQGPFLWGTSRWHVEGKFRGLERGQRAGRNKRRWGKAVK